ncbi:hypothetical protein C8J57DRAFT_1626513 [Mycena rebaudengoi]|nr:hypothetical protein C8J57DRAFT_1626513 [Mycena rebaudengoi]
MFGDTDNTHRGIMEEPSFPPELERHIFELAAVSHRTIIPTLLRVARRVLVWIEPLLYEPAGFFHDSVRHILFERAYDWANQDINALLQRCTGLVGFATAYTHCTPDIRPMLAQLQVKYLTLELTYLFRDLPVDLRHPLFNSVTHLDLFDARNEFNNKIYRQLPLLPALTHLCLKSELPRSLPLRILKGCSNLRVLVNAREQLEDPAHRAQLVEFERNPPVADARFVVAFVIMSFNRFWTDLDIIGRGVRPLWAHADELIAKKSRGEIEASCFWLDATFPEDMRLLACSLARRNSFVVAPLPPARRGAYATRVISTDCTFRPLRLSCTTAFLSPRAVPLASHRNELLAADSSANTLGPHGSTRLAADYASTLVAPFSPRATHSGWLRTLTPPATQSLSIRMAPLLAYRAKFVKFARPYRSPRRTIALIRSSPSGIIIFGTASAAASATTSPKSPQLADRDIHPSGCLSDPIFDSDFP